MRKKNLIISGFLLMILITTIANPIVAETNESKILNRTHIRAVGRFEICNEENILYGHIFIGFFGTKPVFNSDIEISQDNIRWIIMSGFSINGVRTYRFLNCVVTE